jgi:ADP-dependent NAD(P)H-hydrate dehydratase / NAD(P)H-hydrate epimerase
LIPLVTAEEMRTVEHAFVQRGGDLDWLMQQAGMQVASRVPGSQRTLVLAGPGNNGGDALVAASILEQRGDEVSVYTYKRETVEGLPGVRSEEDSDLSLLKHRLERASVVVDGLLGTGRRRSVEDRLKEIIEGANGSETQRIAIDIPTGVDADTGTVETVAFRANLTVTLGFGKRGLWGVPGADYAGKVEIADIGLPPDLRPDSTCCLADADHIARLLPDRNLDWNKGRSGTVLVVAGSYDYSGAPVLVSTAAYRSGAGLVRLVVPERIFPVVAGHGVEEIFAHVESDRWFEPTAVAGITDALGKVEAAAVGPGLGGHPETIEFARELLETLREADIPTVVDADALNAIAEWDGWWEHAPAQTVVTPHPGEMARLLSTDVRSVQADRFSAAQTAARKWGVVVVLKGTNSIVAEPSGAITVNPTGGSNLGTAGTGDVLTGAIAALLAQGLNPADAARAGVWIHGAAGDELRELFGDAGTIASDLWDKIPVIRTRLRNQEVERRDR